MKPDSRRISLIASPFLIARQALVSRLIMPTQGKEERSELVMKEPIRLVLGAHHRCETCVSIVSRCFPKCFAW
jgi:hypothetical protein